MMEIPAGKWCGNCPFRSQDSEYASECLAFEDPAIDKAHFDAHFDLICNGGDNRCPACLAAYPNGATIEIKPKEVHR